MISANIITSYNDLTDKPTIPSEYILPTASTDILGGVKVDGETITILNGIISAVSTSGGGGGWEYSKGTNRGYLKHTESGFKIEYGASDTWSGSSATFQKTFLQPYSSTPALVFVDSVSNSYGLPFVGSVTKTGFTLSISLTNALTYTIRWIAFGY